jgi:hypothetical protein
MIITFLADGLFYPKGLAPLSERIENNGASPFGFKKIDNFVPSIRYQRA